jgi:hypothetical protein
MASWFVVIKRIAILAIGAGTMKRGRALLLLSSPVLNRLLLVGSEILQIHKAVNRELVGIVFSALGKRCDVRSEQRPAIVTTGNAVIERGEDAPYSVGHPFDCSLMHHERSPFWGQTTEQSFVQNKHS